MKKLVVIFGTILAIGGALSSCQRINTLEQRVDTIENNRIATVNEQIAGINLSIESLEALESELNSQLGILKETSTGLETLVEGLQETDNGLSELISVINGNITKLGTADAAINDRIDQLKDYVNNKLTDYATTEWANATFATIEQYTKTANELASLKVTVGGISTSLTNLGIKVEEIDGRLSRNIETLRSNLETKITTDISSAVTSTKLWVTELLDDYYTAAECDEENKYLQDQIDSLKVISVADSAKIVEIRGWIVDLGNALEEAKNDFVNVATQAIEDAINNNDGIIAKAISDSISTVRSVIDELSGTVSGLATTVSELTTGLNELKNKVSDIEGMIQSVAFVPEYSAEIGAVAFHDRDGHFLDLALNYQVTPSDSAARILADAYKTDQDILSVNYRTVKTGTKAGETTDTLKIKSVAVSSEADDVITVIIDSSSLNTQAVKDIVNSSKKKLSVQLHISCGKTDIVSEYTDLTREEATYVDIAEADFTLEIPDDTTLTVVKSDLEDENGYTLSSSDTTVATVDQTGKVKAIAEGTTRIKAVMNDKFAQGDSITVTVIATAVDITEGEVSMKINDTKTLTASRIPSSSTKTIVWNSTDPSVAEVNADGQVTAKKAGSAKIYAGIQGSPAAADTCYVTVVPTVVSIPETLSLVVDQDSTLTATKDPASSTEDVIWGSKDETIATVDAATGKVTGIAEGTAKIFAQVAGGPADTCLVTVSETTVTLNAQNISLETGNDTTLVATLNPTTPSKNLVWSSTAENIATVDQTGKVTAVAVGEAKIVVKVDDTTENTDTCTVTVTHTAAPTINWPAGVTVTDNKKFIKFVLGATVPAGATQLGTSAIYKYTTADTLFIATDATERIIMPAGCSALFKNLTNLTTIVNFGVLDFSAATDISNIFDGCSSLVEVRQSEATNGGLVDLSSIAPDANLTTLSYAFNGCSAMTKLDISGIKGNDKNTSFESCFAGCSSVTEITVGSGIVMNNGADNKTNMWNGVDQDISVYGCPETSQKGFAKTKKNGKVTFK